MTLNAVHLDRSLNPAAVEPQEPLFTPWRLGAIALGEVFTASGPQRTVTPRALDIDEMPGIVAQYRIDSMSDSKPAATFSYLTEQLNRLGITYLHVLDPLADGGRRLSRVRRGKFRRTYLVNGGFDATTASEAIRSGEADLVAFGTPFIANPDLPQRYRTGAALNALDPATLYSGEDKGFTDYPALTE